MRRIQLARGMVVLIALGVAGGCATVTRYAYTPDELRAELAGRIGPERAAALHIPFESTPEIDRLAARLTGPGQTPGTKVELLATALSNPSKLNLRYQYNETRSALETLEKGGGDCLSLTALFIAMGRSLGLEVYFVDARGIQEYAADGTMLVDRRHIVAGWGKPPTFTMIDFDKVNAGSVQYRVITDVQALARFLNNFGFERLKAGANAEAEQQFRTALALDPLFAAAHNNLALALARQGRDQEAEQSLRAALRHDASYSAALFNLVRLLERNGRKEEATAVSEAAAALRLRDPVWRLRLGLEALRDQRYDDAVTDLRAAAQLDPTMLHAWLALAEAYEGKGDRKRALRALDRALGFVPDLEFALQMKARLEQTTAIR